VAETEYRFKIFQENLKSAAELQKLNPRATFGVTLFSDLSKEEFSARYVSKLDESTYERPPPKDFSVATPKLNYTCTPNPVSYDWGYGDCGAVTGVYDMEYCPATGSFAAIELIETQYALIPSTPYVIPMAIGQAVECAGDVCADTYPYKTFEYAMQVGGIEPAAFYPFTPNGNYTSCLFNSKFIFAKVVDYSSLNDEDEIYQYMSSPSGGTVTACIFGDWQQYVGGVVDWCGNSNVTTVCVQVTGYYNRALPGAYWIVRFPFGVRWGEMGYAQLQMGGKVCAISQYAVAATVVDARMDNETN